MNASTSPGLAVVTTIEGSQTVVAVSGELDVTTTAVLRAAVDEAARRGVARLVLHVEQLSFLDSSGVACLVGVRKHLAAREIPLTVRCGRDTPAARLLRFAGLEHLLELE
ncbi:anti-sigma F factor antagonist [Nocardioides sp. AN3]